MSTSGIEREWEVRTPSCKPPPTLAPVVANTGSAAEAPVRSLFVAPLANACTMLSVRELVRETNRLGATTTKPSLLAEREPGAAVAAPVNDRSPTTVQIASAPPIAVEAR